MIINALFLSIHARIVFSAQLPSYLSISALVISSALVLLHEVLYGVYAEIPSSLYSFLPMFEAAHVAFPDFYVDADKELVFLYKLTYKVDLF